MKLPQKQCKTCPFRPDGLKLGQRKMEQICRYLLEGENHLCHKDRTNQTVCQGGRDWQLNMWFELGMISAPTNEALASEMRSVGVEPEEHICN